MKIVRFAAATAIALASCMLHAQEASQATAPPTAKHHPVMMDVWNGKKI